MSDEVLRSLLAALDIAAFSREADGSFQSLSPPPAWFPALADVTFPFLGHILEEATAFWRSGEPGARDYGPCAEVDPQGHEFHYRVRALTARDSGRQFLIFELDPGSDRLRYALQTAREQMLAAEKGRAAQRAAVSEMRAIALEMMQLLNPMPSSTPDKELTRVLSTKCSALMRVADSILG